MIVRTVDDTVDQLGPEGKPLAVTIYGTLFYDFNCLDSLYLINFRWHFFADFLKTPVIHTP